jgi:hypothetical protein
MQLVCPCCNARFPVEAGMQDEAARAAIAVAIKLPASLGELLLRYLSLFRPEQRALSWSRANALLKEISEPLAAAQVTRNRVTRAAPVELWRIGLEKIIETRDQGKLNLPLRGHGYLFEIVWSAAGQMEDAAEKKREQQLAGATRLKRDTKHIAEMFGELKKAASQAANREDNS